MKKYLLCAVGAVVLMSCVSCGKKAEPEPEIVRPVEVKKVVPATNKRTRSFSGSIRSSKESNLSFKVSGRLKSVDVKMGDAVKAGDLIASIDPEDYKLKVMQAQASLEQAKAQARKSSADYDRTRALYENQNASQVDLDTARSNDESAKASLQAAQSELDLAKLQVEYTRLLAPADGGISDVPVEMGENVSAGTTIAILAFDGDREVEVGVPETLISGVSKGDKATITVGAFAGRTFEGVISEVGVTTGEIATTFPIKVRLSNAQELRPGMAAEVQLVFKNKDMASDIMLVDTFAVTEDSDGKRYVFVFEADKDNKAQGKAVRKDVTVGELVGDKLEILKGLSADQTVIVAGVSQIKDGMKVKVMAKPENA